jgi:Protein of unknown function DUF262
MKNRSITTKDIALLHQLYREQQLRLRPEFQRLSVWPRAAKAYLIDTILNDRPMPLFFFQRTMSAQTGRQIFDVIDGQQRLRAIFEFLEDEFGLTESKGGSKAKEFHKLKFSQLPTDIRAGIFNYDLIVEELYTYTDADIRDMFVRMNRYVVKLSKQELRHSLEEGKFAEFAERLGKWKFWKKNRVFSDNQLNRMRGVEFSAELAVLLLEGPQDKKKVLDLYYHTFKDSFPEGQRVESRLREYLEWLDNSPIARTRYRKPVDLYGLIGAVDRVTKGGEALAKLNKERAFDNLTDFEQSLTKRPQREGAKYLIAASRQTDNVIPRTARIEILVSVLTR